MRKVILRMNEQERYEIIKKLIGIIALMDNPYVQRVQSDVIIKIISKIKKIGY